MYVEDMEVRFREGFTDFRMDPSARLQRALSQAAAANRHGRRRWDTGGSPGGPGSGSPGSPHPGGGGGGAPTGHIIRMKRSEAWGKFLAYEGCCQVGRPHSNSQPKSKQTAWEPTGSVAVNHVLHSRNRALCTGRCGHHLLCTCPGTVLTSCALLLVQVCMREGAKGVPEASYFLESGCEPLRTALGITGLLLPTVSPSELAAAVAHGNGAVDVGNEILWDDSDAADKKLSAAAFMNHMSLLKVRSRGALAGSRGCKQTGCSALEQVCRNHSVSPAGTAHVCLGAHQRHMQAYCLPSPSDLQERCHACLMPAMLHVICSMSAAAGGAPGHAR
jgi:hypothetical protein